MIFFPWPQKLDSAAAVVLKLFHYLAFEKPSVEMKFVNRRALNVPLSPNLGKVSLMQHRTSSGIDSNGDALLTGILIE